MELTPIQFLIANGLLVTALVGSFLLLKRGARQPQKLRLSRNQTTAVHAPETVVHSASQATHSDLDNSSSTAEPRVTKELNIFFNYNGHMWEAYESLGIPAGSSVEEARRAFEELRSKMGPESRDFLETALQSILKQR